MSVAARNLMGRLVQQTYPGAPNYESSTKGDEALLIGIVQLDWGACVALGFQLSERIQRERYSSCWAPIKMRGRINTRSVDIFSEKRLWSLASR
jgi:hypothetical protein